MAKKLTIFLTALVISLTAFYGVLPSDTKEISALSGSQFKAGNIISDTLFFNTNAMSATQIQKFLNAKVPTCDTNGAKPYGNTTRKKYSASKGVSTPFICLKNYKANTPERAGLSGICNHITAKTNRTAAQIIDDVARACGVSQKVLLVLLQKEQSLVTDDWPWPIQYRSATGYGCPDTAPCDSEYYGFFNQVYNAARIYKVYAEDNGPNYFRHRNNSIKWHPNSSCGRSTVYIQNQATAGLYNYTPYRPNKEALDNLYGTGDSCSSYGNRNFWRIYNNWFGSTQKEASAQFITCSGQKYAVEAGQTRKRLMTTESIGAWNLQNDDFISNDFRCNYPDFDLDLDRLVRSRDTEKLYIVDEGNAYPITNQSAASAWELGSINQTVPYFNGGSITEHLSVKSSLPQVGKSTNEDVKNVYLVDNGNRYTIAGTPSGDTKSLQLIRGNNEVPMATFSVDLLQTLTASSTINYSFKVGSDWYLLDHNKTRKISSSAMSTWDDLLSGPTLSADVLKIFDENSTLGFSFNRGSYFYRLQNGASEFERTSSRSVAKNWGILNSSPIITILLADKLVQSIPYDEVLGLDGNVRLIECGGDKYLVERYIKVKRSITPEALTAWRFDDKYFLVNESACGYPTYSLELGQLIRSRSTQKVYYVDEGKAYYVHSQSAANAWGFGNIKSQEFPQFDGKSINDTLTVVDHLPPP